MSELLSNPCATRSSQSTIRLREGHYYNRSDFPLTPTILLTDLFPYKILHSLFAAEIAPPGDFSRFCKSPKRSNGTDTQDFVIKQLLHYDVLQS